MGAVRRRTLPHDDDARLWVEYQEGYLKMAFKDVMPTWNQEKALRERLRSPGNRWMGKDKLIVGDTSTSSPGLTGMSPGRREKVATSVLSGKAGSATPASPASWNERVAAGASASTSLFATGSGDAMGEGGVAENELSDFDSVPRPHTAGYSTKGGTFDAVAFDTIQRGRQAYENYFDAQRQDAQNTNASRRSRGRRLGRSSLGLRGGSRGGRRQPRGAASTTPFLGRSPPAGVFATTVSLERSSLTVPAADEASLNPGKFALAERPSRAGFFLPVSSGRNNPAARAYRAARARKEDDMIEDDPGVSTSEQSSGTKTSRARQLLHTVARLRADGRGSGDGEGKRQAPTPQAYTAHHSIQSLDPLGVTVAMNRFDRSDVSFGVKAGDLLVSPLGRTVEMVGVGTLHRAAMAGDGMIHMSAPVNVPFVDFKTKCGWTKRRSKRADLVGYKRGQGLAPMESVTRMDEFMGTDGGGKKSGGASITNLADAASTSDDGYDEESEDIRRYLPRYVPAPAHVGIAAKAREMDALREDRVLRHRELEAHAQWPAARGVPPLDDEEAELAAWASRIREAHALQTNCKDDFQRGYLDPRGKGMAPGPKPPVAATATRAFGGMKPLNEILPRPAIDASRAHWSLNRPAAQGEYTPLASANRMCLI